MRWLRRTAIVALALLLVLALLLGGTAQGRAVSRTALLVSQLVPALPVKPQTWVSRAPVREEVSYPRSEGDGLADLYRVPGDEVRAGIVLFLGVNPAGRDDERVINLGEALARAGFVVLVPWSRSMVEEEITLDEIENLVSAFGYLQSRSFVDPDRVGLAGFCVGSSLALVAAAHPAINEDVRFVNFFGGYYDAEDLLVQIASGQSFYKGDSEPWEPDSLTREVFTKHLIQGLPDVTDREVLRRRFLRDDPVPAEEIRTLSRYGRVAHDILDGGSLEEMRELVERLPPPFLENLERISPSHALEGVKGRVLAMHDREDNLVPVEESRRLRDALEGRNNFRYTEFAFFQHVDPTEPVGPLTLTREAFKLFWHLNQIVNTSR